jgi:hypothetical protein
VPCTLLLFTYAHSFLKNGADLTLYVWRVMLHLLISKVGFKPICYFLVQREYFIPFVAT